MNRYDALYAQPQRPKVLYPCTECQGDAQLGYVANHDNDWQGRIKPGERLCVTCAGKRGIDCFGRMTKQ